MIKIDFEFDDCQALDIAYASYTGEEYIEAASDEKVSEVFSKFHKLVNMSKSQLEKWAENECSKMASLSRAPLNRVIKLLSTPKEDWGASQVKQANRVISFISRMSKAENGEPVKTKSGKTCPSKRDISLRNWGYNP